MQVIIAPFNTAALNFRSKKLLFSQVAQTCGRMACQRLSRQRYRRCPWARLPLAEFRSSRMSC
jgi:hypothetical protein